MGIRGLRKALREVPEPIAVRNGQGQVVRSASVTTPQSRRQENQDNENFNRLLGRKRRLRVDYALQDTQNSWLLISGRRQGMDIASPEQTEAFRRDRRLGRRGKPKRISKKEGERRAEQMRDRTYGTVLRQGTWSGRGTLWQAKRAANKAAKAVRAQAKASRQRQPKKRRRR